MLLMSIFIRQFIALRNDAYVCMASRQASSSGNVQYWNGKNTLIYFLIDLFIYLLICLQFYVKKRIFSL